MTLKNKKMLDIIPENNNYIICDSVVRVLNKYGYLTNDNVLVKSRLTSVGSKMEYNKACETTFIDGAETRFVNVMTDLRYLDDGATYIHIGVKANLHKKLTMSTIINIEKHLILNVNNLDEIDMVITEMLRDLIF